MPSFHACVLQLLEHEVPHFVSDLLACPSQCQALWSCSAKKIHISSSDGIYSIYTLCSLSSLWVRVLYTILLVQA